jgi:hypothetical protein
MTYGACLAHAAALLSRIVHAARIAELTQVNGGVLGGIRAHHAAAALSVARATRARRSGPNRARERRGRLVARRRCL